MKIKPHFMQLTLAYLLFPFFCLAQDKITTTNGKTFKCNIEKITSKHIKYYLLNDEELKTISLSSVYEVEDELGIKQVYTEDYQDDFSEDYKTLVNLKRQGKQDAKENYERYGAGPVATTVTTMLAGGVIGLIPAIATSSTAPHEKRLDYPDEALFDNATYRKAYVNQAHKMKSGQVWKAYLAGILTNVLIVLMFLIAL